MTCPSCDIWLEKTEWVQKTAKPRELGLHRADVLKQRIRDIPLDLLEADLTYRAAYTLAQTIFHKHYAHEHSTFKALDTTRGILTQIDNMVAGLERKT